MKQLSFRLHPGELLKEAIEKRVKENDIKAGVVLSMVGSLENAVLRMANTTFGNQVMKKWNGPFEIVSGTGTISKDGCHIHIALADTEGNVIGGHLRDGCIVKYTAEIVVGIFDDVVFHRRMDSDTGFHELEIE